MRDRVPRRYRRLTVIVVAGLTLILAHPSAAEVQEPLPSILRVSARGRVLTADGQPQAGARVALRAASTPALVGLMEFPDVIAETVTDGQGLFVFDRVSISATMNHAIEALHDWKRGVDVVVIAKGFAINWAPLYSFENPDDITVTLKPAAPLEGIVSDTEGTMLPGAEVTVIGISKFDVPFDGLLRGPGELRLYNSSLRPRTTTGPEGMFRIQQLPADCHIHLYVVHPDYQRQYVITTTSNDSPVKPLNLTRRAGPPEFESVHARPVKVKLESGPRLHVRVFDEEANAPVTTGRIVLTLQARPRIWKTALETDGTAAITVAEPGEYELMYLPENSNDGLHMSQRLTLTKQATFRPQEVELRLPPKRWLEGRVVGRGTEIGVGGVTVAWSAVRADADEASFPFFSRTPTDLDGRFRLPVMARVGTVDLSGEASGYFVASYRTMPRRESKRYAIQVDAPTDDDNEPMRIEVPRGLVVRGSVRDKEGKAAVGAVIRARSLGRYGPRFGETVSNETGQFELAGLNPREYYELSAAVGNDVASQAVEGDEDHSIEVARELNVDLQLAPTVSLRGRVLLNGNPLAKVRMELVRQHRVNDNLGTYRTLDSAMTSDDGTYKLVGLQPGHQYHINIHSPNPAVDPSWLYQSPYVQTLPTDAKGEVELPDVRLSRMTQTLAGIVVDPDGNPVEGARVSAKLKSGRSVPRPRSGPPPWTETGDDGTFRLTQLPEQPLQLMAYIPPKGTDRRIRFPARVECKMNQQDIRILLDPSLVEDE